MEKIDIYDADLRHIGVEERLKAHELGLWHETFHLWIVSPKNGGQILYQWRSHEMKNFPDMLDVSAAGHLIEGEQMENGIREAEEELGICLKNSKIHKLGYRVEVADQSNGQKNREYQGVHMVLLNIEIDEFSPQLEEVSGLYWVNLYDGMEVFLDKSSNCECRGTYYNTDSKSWETKTRIFSIDNFLPRIQNYYLTIHIMAERLLEDKMPLAIS